MRFGIAPNVVIVNKIGFGVKKLQPYCRVSWALSFSFLYGKKIDVRFEQIV
jgi:hypothetical protein